MTLAELEPTLQRGWFSFRHFALGDPPAVNGAYGRVLARLPVPASLTEQEQAWLEAHERATSWSGDDFVRLSQLRLRRPPSAEVYEERAANLRDLQAQCLALGLTLPDDELVVLLGPSKLEAIMRTRVDSVLVALSPRPAPLPTHPDIAVVGVLADVQAAGFWSLLLDRAGEHRVVFSFDPLVDDGLLAAPATPKPYVCAPSVATFIARLLTDLS